MKPVTEWADRMNDKAVKCRRCHCVFTEPYETYTYDPKTKSMGYKTIGGIPTNGCPCCKRADREEKRKALPLNPELVAAVRTHANENYTRGGWDYVVETHSDKDIWEVIAGSKTPAAAIKKMAGVAAMYKEREDEIRATAW